jgi:hypothetical protein
MKGCIEDQKLKITLSGRNPRTDALKYFKNRQWISQQGNGTWQKDEDF